MKNNKNGIQLLKSIKLSVKKSKDIPKENKENSEDNKTKNGSIEMNFSETSDKNNENEDNSYMEKQLSLLLEVFLTTYSKKTYPELIKDIEEKEILLCSNSLMSFKILILKVQCLIKCLLNEYNNILRFKSDNFHEVDSVVQKIQFEFKKISKMIIQNNSYEYEIMTQVYCKFLYLLSKISLKKEDNIKSLGFISLGINILKVFIIRKKLATDIKTYNIYCKLLLLLINTLIGDNNYEQALFYSRLLLKIIEISQKFIYFTNLEGDEEKRISPLKTKKFIKYAGYAFLYIGCCLEQYAEDIQAFEAYKQATYFLDRGSIAGNPFKNVNIVSINNSCNYCAMEIFEKFKLKFEREKIERMQRQNTLEKLKKLQKYQLLQNEKQIKLKLIANGYIGDPFKYNKLEEKIEKMLFPSSIQHDLDKIDDELISFVFTYFNKNKGNEGTPYKNKMSLNTKKLVSRYELYNILMSKDFRDFVMKTKKLQFNNPKKGSESISTIQRYLNNKMEIQIERNKTHKKTIRYNDKPSNYLIIAKKNKANDVVSQVTFPTTCPNSKREEDCETKFTLPSNNNELFKNKKKVKIKKSLIKNKQKPNTIKSEIYNCSPSFRLSSKSKNLSSSRKKKILNELECDFERKNFDKNLMTKNYLKKYAYYENLSNKEIKLQKALLDFRGGNTLYNARRALEEKDNKVITKEEIINKFLVIDEAVKENTKVIVKDEELEMIKETFTSGDDNKLGCKMKSAMTKVIHRYILERKKKQQKKNNKILSSDEIKRVNEKNLLELNYTIKNINNNISNVRHLAGNSLSDKIYN